MSDYLLEAKKISKSFGGIKAVRNVSFEIPHACIYGIIGPNGAGKTTLFNIITGLYSSDEGVIIFEGNSITNHSPEKIVRRGIARTFQNIRLFKNLSVLENVMIGRHARTFSGPIGAITRTPAVRDEESETLDKSQQLLSYVGLATFSHKMANELSYGDQRRLEIARALATEPKLLALDEPAAGMNPSESIKLQSLIETMHSDGINVFIIEHDVKLMMNLCHKILVLDYGEVIAEGTPPEVRKNPKVIEAYLGSTTL